MPPTPAQVLRNTNLKAYYLPESSDQGVYHRITPCDRVLPSAHTYETKGRGRPGGARKKLNIKPPAAQSSRAKNRAIDIEATGSHMIGKFTGGAKDHRHPASLKPCIVQIMLDTFQPEMAGHPKGSASSPPSKKITAVTISRTLPRPRWPVPSSFGRPIQTHGLYRVQGQQDSFPSQPTQGDERGGD